MSSLTFDLRGLDSICNVICHRFPREWALATHQPVTWLLFQQMGDHWVKFSAQSLVHSSTCCSSLGDVGCFGFPVCQPCLSQHPHQRSISPAGFWIWGLPLVSLLFCKKNDFSFYMVIFIWQSYDKLSCPNLDIKITKCLFFLSFSMQSCWPWCWQHLLNTFCTLLTWTVRIPGKIRLSTCSILSSSQVLYITMKSGIYMHCC